MSQEKPRVLVVEDDLSILTGVSMNLRFEGYEVLQAQDGARGLEMAVTDAPDLIVLDVMMPDLDGFEVCRRLKSNPITLHIPVVMVTALDQPSDKVRGLEAGADDFLTKPIPELALIARVRSLARLKMVTDELRMRVQTSREIGIDAPERAAVADTGREGKVLIVDDRPASYERIAGVLSAEHT
ncbi:MAG TPA: response regulator, partial [Myxococcaceae bacterium]